MKRILLFAIISIMTVHFAFAEPMRKPRWEFNDLKAWRDDSQNKSPKSYTITEGRLRISTRKQTRDRVKIRTIRRFGVGHYTWRIFVPTMGKGDQASIGAFLYRDDKHEVDFEIGFGTAKLREKLKAKDDDLVCYCTSQGFPYSSSQLLVKRDTWHTFSIKIAPGKDNRYSITWFIDGKQTKQLQTSFGNEISFTVHCSVENLTFIGDHIPTQENYAIFDYVDFVPDELKRAEFLRRVGNFIDAEQSIERHLSTLSHKANAIAVLEQLAKIYISWEKLEQADTVAERLLQEYANEAGSAAAVKRIGIFYGIQGRKHDRAYSLFQRIKEKWPGSDQVFWSQRAEVEVAIRLRRYAEAESAVEELLKAYSGHSRLTEALHGIAADYVRMGELTEAGRYYLLIVKKWPQSDYALWAQKALVSADIRAANHDAAETRIKDVLSAFGGHQDIAEVLRRLGNDYLRKKNYQDASRLYQHVIEHYPRSDEVQLAHRGMVKVKAATLDLSNDPTADAKIDQLTSRFTDKPYMAQVLLHYIGDQYQMLNKYDRSDAVYRRLIDIDPKSDQAAHARGALAWTYIERKLYDHAVNEYVQVIEQHPDSLEACRAQYWIGQCYSRNKELGKALVAFQKVIERYPDSKEADFASDNILLLKKRKEGLERRQK